MTGELKKKVKLFLKKVKQFKKVSKKNSEEGVILAEELIVESTLLTQEKHFQDEKESKEILKVIEILKLYIENVKTLDALEVKFK